MSIYYCESLPHGVQRNGHKLNTRTHAEYITRQGDYEHMRNREEDLVYRSSGNMPDWADNELDFFQAAEDKRRFNGRAYREIRLGLQEELSLEENIACIEEFLKETGITDNHAYIYAVHDKTAMFADDHRNIHAHIMFSEKLIDKDRPLDRDTYFSRYSETKDGYITGGYAVDRSWSERGRLPIIRKQWADIVNSHFEKLDMDIKISEKTLKEQRKEALENGQYEEAELLNREPAPQLRDSIKNPQKRKMIRTMEHLITADSEKAADVPTDGDENIISPKTKYMIPPNKFKIEEELKMAIFAHDMIIRRLAKEIQKERAKERAKQKAEYKQYLQKAEELEPVIVTVGDVMAKAEEHMAAISENITETTEKLKTVKQNYIPKKDIRHIALTQATNGRYEELNHIIKAYKKQISEKRKIYKIQDKAYNENNAKIFNSLLYHKTRIELNQLKEQQRPYIKELVQLHTEIHGNSPLAFTYNAKKNELLKDSEKANKEMAALTKNIEIRRRQYDTLYKKMEQLFDDDPSRILYADKLPDTVSIYSKLDGVTPLKEQLSVSRNVEYIDTKIKEKEQYIITENVSIKEMEEQYRKTQQPISLKAVRINDPVTQGMADIYRVEVIPAVSKEGRPYLKIDKVYRTKDRQLLYQVRQIGKKYRIINRHASKSKLNNQNHIPNRAGHMTPKAEQSISNLFTKVMNEQVPVGPQMHYQEEQDIDKEKSEMEKAEEKVRGGWSL